MAVAEIIKYPNKILEKPCEPVTEFNELLKVKLKLMSDTMIEANGIGLAANQIGLDKAMFVMLDNDKKLLNIINPVLVEFEGNSLIKEGCLSLPDVYVQILNRANSVTIDFQNEEGEWFTGVFNGLEAICVQHEMEHLRGEFFLDNLTKGQRRKLLNKKGKTK